MMPFVIFLVGAAAGESPFIAGLDPANRPKDAPVVTTVDNSPARRARDLSGVEAPIPENLDFLDDQGNWFTPFSRPGMDGHYDIRGWHRRE